MTKMNKMTGEKTERDRLLDDAVSRHARALHLELQRLGLAESSAFIPPDDLKHAADSPVVRTRGVGFADIEAGEPDPELEPVPPPGRVN